MMNLWYDKFLRLLAITMLGMLVFNAAAIAQTGKISGKVIDAQSRDPLPGVNIVLEGTTLGAATDSDGDYFIINIPPGRYSAQVTMVGYSSQVKTDVLVQMDRTVTVDFQMGTQAVQGEAVTISAEREIIQMDLSGSSTYMAGEEMTSSPVISVVDYLQIQEGVEFTSSNGGKFLSIRGGDRDETDFLVDGLSTMNANLANSYMAVSRTAIKEVSIQTGGFNAEYGRVRSGLVNVVTRDGSREQYSLALESQYSFSDLKHFGRNLYDRDNPYYIVREGQNNFLPGSQQGASFVADGDPKSWGLQGEVIIDENSPEYRGWTYDAETDVYADNSGGVYSAAEREQYGMEPVGGFPQQLGFSGWNAMSDDLKGNNQISDDLEPADLLAEWMVQHEGIEYGNKPDYDMDVTFTGPLPGESMGNRLGDILSTSTFMVSYRSQTARLPYPSSRRDYRDHNLQAKLTSRLGSATKLRFNMLYGEAASVNAHWNDEALVGGGSGGLRASGDMGRAWNLLFNEGAILHSNTYLFQTSARLTHTVSPRTYFELEYMYQQNVDNQNPMRPADLDSHTSWMYNIDGLANTRGEPRTFLTNDPSDIFVDGVAQRLDPILRSQINQDINGMSAVAGTNLNARNQPFSTGGSGTWEFSRELMSQWFDDQTLVDGLGGLKGPSRLDIATGAASDIDPATLPGSFDYGHVLNMNYEPNLTLPQNGGLVYGQTLPGITLVQGNIGYNGWRQGTPVDRIGEYRTFGEGRSLDRTRTQMHGGKATMVSQLTKHNQFKLGVDFRFYHIVNMQTVQTAVPAADVGFRSNFNDGAERFDIAGSYLPWWPQFNDNPFEASLYLQDKIEVQGLIANIGIRADIYDPTSEAVDFSQPFDRAYASSNVGANGPGHFDTAPKANGKVQVKWSPRLGLSFPVTEASKVYFNYGWFYQRPRLRDMLVWIAEPTTKGVSTSTIPNVNLDWPRTIQMEMGYEQNIKGWFLFHAAGFFKDSDDLIRPFQWENSLGDLIMSSDIASGYSDVRGIEFRLDKNYGLFRARTNYTYLIRSSGRAGAAKEWQNLISNLSERENTVRSLQENRPHPQPNFRGTFGFFSPRQWGPKIGEKVHPFDNIIVNMIYTWDDRSDRMLVPGIIASENIYVDNVNRSNTNVRAEKRIGIGRRMNLGFFVQVFNLWNQKFLVGPSGNNAIEETFTTGYENAFRYDSKYGSSTPAGNDVWGEYKPAHLRDTLPWWKDNILFDDKRDIYYGISFTIN
jgi:hypothetical protein